MQGCFAGAVKAEEEDTVFGKGGEAEVEAVEKVVRHSFGLREEGGGE